MEKNRHNRICPVEHAGALDIDIRKLVHNPKKILGPYIRPGMTVLDVGCGPGFFTLEIAKMTGEKGKVIAADLQNEMLEMLKDKIKSAGLSNIQPHLCRDDQIGVTEKADLILVFYMLHEVPDQTRFLQEIKTLLKPGGKVLIVEPKFHVSKKNFQDSLSLMIKTGFEIAEKPKVFFSRGVLLKSAN